MPALPFLLMAAAIATAQPMAVEIVADPITDAVRAIATVRHEGHRLVVACEPARFTGYRITVHSRRWLARGNIFTGERPFIYRFDRNVPVRHMWDVSDRRATLLGDRANATFLRDLRSAELLVVRARDIENHRFDMSFPLAGVDAAVDRALAACAGDETAQDPPR